uniref:Uncharacterized protein n=1 Tax=Romanomermis culicivorax TaxID=13658 RepID=A0A915KF71_ROMCU
MPYSSNPSIPPCIGHHRLSCSGQWGTVGTKYVNVNFSAEYYDSRIGYGLAFVNSSRFGTRRERVIRRKVEMKIFAIQRMSRTVPAYIE